MNKDNIFEKVFMSLLILLLVTPLVYFTYHGTKNLRAEANEKLVQRFGQTITNTAEQMSYSASASQRTLYNQMPESVRSIDIEEQNTLVIGYEKGNNTAYAKFTSVPKLSNKISSEDLPIDHLILKKVKDVIVLCSKDCTCTPEICDDSLDNDCDSSVDSTDVDC